jgi:hypothetical protein
MATISTSLPADGDTIDAADYNTPINTIVNVINGNLDSDNLAANAVGTSEIADSSVTYAKTDGKIWWEEIGRTTLSAAGDTITVSTIPARKYLTIIVSTIPTGGTISNLIQFNGDTGANYAGRYSDSGAADSTAISQTTFGIAPGIEATNALCTMTVLNIAAQEKICIFNSTRNAAGAGTAPGASPPLLLKWANTANQISSVVLINSGTGDFAIGSEIVVLGHN